MSVRLRRIVCVSGSACSILFGLHGVHHSVEGITLGNSSERGEGLNQVGCVFNS